MWNPLSQDSPRSDPHARTPTLTLGKTDRGAVILLHGRGASAEDILSLGQELGVEGLGLIAPQAAGNTWYPQSFLAPLDNNQPDLDSALARIETLVESLLQSGLASSKIALLGFSQGACLTTEFVARTPRRYGAVIALTGGRIGPPGTTWNSAGNLDGTPVFLGANDPDPHVPFARVRETEANLRQMGGSVELRRYPGQPHSVNRDEIEVAATLLRGMLGEVGS